jgi:hypothetical protein
MVHLNHSVDQKPFVVLMNQAGEPIVMDTQVTLVLHPGHQRGSLVALWTTGVSVNWPSDQIERGIP